MIQISKEYIRFEKTYIKVQFILPIREFIKFVQSTSLVITKSLPYKNPNKACQQAKICSFKTKTYFLSPLNLIPLLYLFIIFYQKLIIMFCSSLNKQLALLALFIFQLYLTNSIGGIPFLSHTFKINENEIILPFDQQDKISFSVVSTDPNEQIQVLIHFIVGAQKEGIGSVTLETTAPSTASYYFQFYTLAFQRKYYSAKTIVVKKNQIIIKSLTTYSPQTYSVYNKFSVSSICEINQIIYRGYPYYIDISIIKWKEFLVNGVSGSPVVFFQPYNQIIYQKSFTITPGQYILFIEFDSTSDQSATILLTTSCNSFCKSQLNLPQQQTCIPVCGDGIKGYLEECDNGNRTGCSKNCIPDLNYICYGPLGSSSHCQKKLIYGDGVLDNGQICDNGNREGCSQGCKVDKGYKCSSDIGKVSLCSFCGNGVVQYGEECDNRNQLGCSNDCKIQPGFQCVGISSICWRKNPVCGNGINEIAQMCDDGNILNQDGCNKFCRVQIGYNCLGQLYQKSSCTKNNSVCGNQIFEPFSSVNGLMQQCDNGNHQGCQGCVIQNGWSWISTRGQKSNCFKIMIQHCGNGILDFGESCQDGNIQNGDGCNSKCQVEFGWTCKKDIGCTKNSNFPILPSSFCGNGKVEFGQQCDDGFPLKNEDGCNIKCRIQAGWRCSVANGYSICNRL